MRLFQKRGIWHVELDSGKRRSLRTRDKAEARRLFADVRKQWLAGKLAHLTGQCQKTLGEFVDEYLRWAESVQLFPKWRHPDTLSHYIKRCLARAGYGHLHLHHLRHTFASLKAMEGATLQEIQALLGHKDIKATMIYSHLSDEHIRKVAEVNLGPVDLGG